MTSVIWAGPVGPTTNLSPDDVILNKGAVQNGKTFDVNGATIAALTSNTIKAQSITVGGVPLSTATITAGDPIYPATGTIVGSKGALLSTVTVTGQATVGSLTTAGAINGTTVNGTTGTYSGTVTGSNLSGTNTGDVTIGTGNGLSLAGQALSAALASSTSTGTLRAFDFNTFNNKLSPTGNGSGLTDLTKTQVGLSNVQNVDQTDAANVTTGTFDPARLATGTPSGVRYVRGDGFWALITSTTVGLGQVLNGAQVLRTEYTQKGGFLVGIGTGGIYAVQAPGTDGYVLVANSASSTGLSYVTPPSSFSIYPASATGIFPYGARLATVTVDGLALFRGLVNGTTLYFSSGTFTGPLNASNLSGTNTGDVTLGTANGLVIQNQVLSLSTASATQDGALTASDWTRFNNESTGTGHFNDVYVSSSLTWPDSYVQRVHGPVFNVKDYGATGNGTTDDYASVQAALTAAHNANGGIVFAPAGTYVIGATLIMYSSTTLTGAGIGPTIIKAKPNLNARLINVSAPAYNVNLMNATFDMNGSTQSDSTAITIGGVHGHLVKNVRMINPYDSLYLLTGSPDITNNDNAVYEDVFFDGTNQNQTTDVVDIGSATNVRATRIRAYNCKAGTGDALVVFGITQNVTITDSVFDANGNGTPVVLVGLNGGKMDGCELKNGFEAGVRMTYWNEIAPSYPMKNFQLVNNNIHDNAYDGIWINHAGISTLRPENILIANNTIWNNQQSGFRCLVSSGVIFTGNYVFNNSLAGVGSYYAMNFTSAFSVPGEVNNIHVSNNRFYDTQATHTQTKLYALSYVDQFISAGNVFSQITTTSTVANSTNVSITDQTSPVVTGPLYGGTGLTSYTQGDLLYAVADNVLATIPKSGFGTRSLCNTGSANAPEWALVNLVNGVSNTLPVSSGGTGTDATLVNNRVMISSGGLIAEAPVLVSSSVLISNVNGIPTASVVKSTEVANLTGTTSNIQTQLNNKAPLAVAPTIQKFTSGSGTYTTPTSPRVPLYIRVRMVGGGGGGAGGGTGAATDGGDGGNSTFGSGLLISSAGTKGKLSSSGGPALGGAASVGTAIGTAVKGGDGQGLTATAIAFQEGGTGGNSALGGGGASGGNSPGTAGSPNTGGGGGGGGTNGTGANAGGGGGAGGFVDAIITSPTTSYSYVVGAAGTAGTVGTNGFSGGAGGSGYIEVTEYYQ